MILKGQISLYQLLFEANIEKVAKRKARQRQKKDKEILERDPQPLLFFPIIFFQEESNMAEEQAPPPKRTLRDYVMYQGQRIFLVLQYLLQPKPWK